MGEKISVCLFACQGCCLDEIIPIFSRSVLIEIVS